MCRTSYFYLLRSVRPIEDAVANDTRNPVVSFDDPRSRTIQEFSNIENFSLSFYYSLRRRKLAPKEIRPPDSKIVRITAAAHAEWRDEMQILAESDEAALQEERRRQQTAAAGRRAAQVRRG